MNKSIESVVNDIRVALKLGKRKPVVGLVLGTGFGDFVPELPGARSMPFSDIIALKESVEGHENRLWAVEIGGTLTLVMQGRQHLYEGYTPEEVVFLPRVMMYMGIKALILTHAVGGINPAYKPGDLVLDADHIGFLCPSPMRGPNIDMLGPRFTSMHQVYHPRLRLHAQECAFRLKMPKLPSGVSFFWPGPEFETPAELVALAHSFRADTVTESSIPEAKAAAHAKCPVLGIAGVTDVAREISKRELTHGEVLANGSIINNDLAPLLIQIIKTLPKVIPEL